MTSKQKEKIKDTRLPKEYYVFKNSFGEYVVLSGGRIAQVYNKRIDKYDSVSASITLEGAIQYFLNGETEKKAYLGD